jgi:hypothetical protein
VNVVGEVEVELVRLARQVQIIDRLFHGYSA